MRQISDLNAAKELETAVAFDVRDNPKLKEYLTGLVNKKGAAGVRDFVDAIKKEVSEEYAGKRTAMMFPWTRSAVRTLIEGGVLWEQWGLGQWGAIIGTVLSAAIQAGAGVYTAHLTMRTQTNIANIQVDAANKQAAAAQAQAEAAKAQADAQIKSLEASGGGSPFGASTGVSQAGMFGGMSMGTLGIMAVVGLAAAFILPKLKKG
jgi:hypothetical protein